ncbi:MAG: hypothetical protein FWG81_07795 [Betaproteobacteria bacterium]|nr:hypothetical protein [Betaproteobacteria bacterium]
MEKLWANIKRTWQNKQQYSIEQIIQESS